MPRKHVDRKADAGPDSIDWNDLPLVGLVRTLIRSSFVVRSDVQIIGWIARSIRAKKMRDAAERSERGAI